MLSACAGGVGSRPVFRPRHGPRIQMLEIISQTHLHLTGSPASRQWKRRVGQSFQSVIQTHELRWWAAFFGRTQIDLLCAITQHKLKRVYTDGSFTPTITHIHFRIRGIHHHPPIIQCFVRALRLQHGQLMHLLAQRVQLDRREHESPMLTNHIRPRLFPGRENDLSTLIDNYAGSGPGHIQHVRVKQCRDRSWPLTRVQRRASKALTTDQRKHRPHRQEADNPTPHPTD